MSGIRGEYRKGKMKVSVKMQRVTANGRLRNLTTHVFVPTSFDADAIFKRVAKKHSNLDIFNMYITKVWSQESRYFG